MDKLIRLRQEIDECDKKLLTIFQKRLNLVKEILIVKRERGQAILKPEREREIIERAVKAIKDADYSEEAEKFIEQILKISRGYQSRKLFPYNISLIGFMGSGKTRVGNELAKVLEMSFVDCDDIIEESCGMPVSKIFEIHGEQYFRNIENNTIRILSKRQNTIIITGGGAVINPENVEHLKKNGVIIFLKSSPDIVYDRIKNDCSRPVLDGKMTVKYISELYGKRFPAYHSAADIIVNSEDTLEVITNAIINQLYSMDDDFFERLSLGSKYHISNSN
ncbi:MAG: chorismate mutase [Bacillota bacterium]|nr:chorismate mutase [Bacillota bacterium]